MTHTTRTDEERPDTYIGTVYFVQDFHGTAIKIGYTAEPLDRLFALQTAHPLPLIPLGTTPGTRALERDLHVAFGHDRLLGEWFRPSEELAERIKLLCDDSVDCRRQAKRLRRLALTRKWISA